MNLGGRWPRVSSVTAGADIRQSSSARSCISPQSSFHSRWCLSCICGNHLGKSCFFFVFFLQVSNFLQNFPSSHLNLKMKHLKGYEIYVHVHLSKSQSKLQKWSGVKGSSCLPGSIAVCSWSRLCSPSICAPGVLTGHFPECIVRPRPSLRQMRHWGFTYVYSILSDPRCYLSSWLFLCRWVNMNLRHETQTNRL